MTGDTINHLVRTVVLIGLLSWFSIALVRGLMHDERQGGFGRVTMGAGPEPGVRVLITNRPAEVRDYGQPLRTWERLDIAVLQPVEVVTPSFPDQDEHRLTVRAGSYLRIEPDGTDGMVLSSPEWGKQHNWAVSVVRVVPRSTRPEATATPDFDPRSGVDASHPALRDPSSYEAADGGAVFALPSTYRYRGQIEVVWNSPKDLVAINCLPTEAYVEGVVAVEMPPSYPLEALKAQAIASRGVAFAKRIENLHRKQGKPLPFDLMDSLNDQEYRGAGIGNAMVLRAVQSTRGLITAVDGVPFAPLFCASSGGSTEAIDNVLPGAKDALGRTSLSTMMLPQRDDQCLPAAQALGQMNSHWTTTEVLKSDELRSRLANFFKAKDLQVGHINQIRVAERDARSTRVKTVEIWHTMGDPLRISGHDFRMLMGPSRIRSTLWSDDSPRKIDTADRKKAYQITCYGFGHGVGMSQISAWQLATDGMAAAAILQRFYGPRLELVQKW